GSASCPLAATRTGIGSARTARWSLTRATSSPSSRRSLSLSGTSGCARLWTSTMSSTVGGGPSAGVRLWTASPSQTARSKYDILYPSDSRSATYRGTNPFRERDLTVAYAQWPSGSTSKGLADAGTASGHAVVHRISSASSTASLAPRPLHHTLIPLASFHSGIPSHDVHPAPHSVPIPADGTSRLQRITKR